MNSEPPTTTIRVAVGEHVPDGNPVERETCKVLDDLHPPTFTPDGRRATGYTFQTVRPLGDSDSLVGLLHVFDAGQAFESHVIAIPQEVAEWLADHAAGNSPPALLFGLELPVIV